MKTSISPQPGGFVAGLRASAEDLWAEAVGHRFVDELLAGTVADDVLLHYLEQDYRFYSPFLSLLGAAVATSDRTTSKVRLGRQLGFVTSDEDDYFERALRELGSSAQHADSIPLTPAARRMITAMEDAAATQSYAQALVVLVVAEWLYLDWGERSDAVATTWLHRKWIDLHRGAQFRDWVQLLVDELDRVGAALSAEERAAAQQRWDGFVGLELEFFAAAYEDRPAD